ncbi:ankyrin repeat domain-containing protein [Candidatus Micrarchaeota archaeon]|nr:ankyrin repeat domain-containing protein [Candidatus Micrarchaeota archaeon]
MGATEELFEAVKKGNLEAAKKAIENGADVHVRTTDNDSLLHFAAFNGYYELSELLLDKGVDVDARDKHEWTPLHDAASRGHYRIARLLLERGADPAARTRMNYTAYQFAVDQKNACLALLVRPTKRRSCALASNDRKNFRPAFRSETQFKAPKHQRNPDFRTQQKMLVA